MGQRTNYLASYSLSWSITLNKPIIKLLLQAGSCSRELILFSLHDDVRTNSGYRSIESNGWMTINNELERMWKEAAVA
jgi:hypothetical protein